LDSILPQRSAPVAFCLLAHDITKTLTPKPPHL
jgi:hypothetical protein